MATEQISSEDESPQRLNRMWLLLLGICAAALIVAVVLILVNKWDESWSPAALELGWAVSEGEATVGTVVVGVDLADEGKNSLRVSVAPVAGSWLESVNTVDVALLPYRGDAQAAALTLELKGDERRAKREFDFAGSDAWEIRVTSDDRRLATFFVLLPDPNLFGNERIALLADDADARALYQQASQAVANWHRIQYEQQTSDGAGLAVVSFRDVNDGTDGSAPGFRYYTPGGLEAYVVGTTAWSRYPGEDWEVQETSALIPPSEWGGEFEGATGFQLGPMSETPQGPCRVITFVVPGDQRQAIAWYAWCVDESTGMLYRDSMIARAHYMITEFSNFDGDISVTPPEGVETPTESSQSGDNASPQTS